MLFPSFFSPLATNPLLPAAERVSLSRPAIMASASATLPRLSNHRGDSGNLRRNHQVKSAPEAPSTITHRHPLIKKCVGTSNRESTAATGTAQNPATCVIATYRPRARPGTTSVTYVSITTISAPIPTPAKNRNPINHAAEGANAPTNVNTE